MKDIAIISVLFDYPSGIFPNFYRKALLEFDENDVHVLRDHNLIESQSIYDKYTFYKIFRVLEYIKLNILGKYKYILFLDATDTAFTKPISPIIQKFEQLNCSILFCAEKGIWPHTGHEHLYENKKTTGDYKYLNSGGYFGYTEEIVKHMTSIQDNVYNFTPCDQGKWVMEYLLNDTILIDHECKIFFSTYESKEHILVDGLNYTLKDNIDAHIIHDNGPYTGNTIKVAHCYE